MMVVKQGSCVFLLQPLFFDAVGVVVQFEQAVYSVSESEGHIQMNLIVQGQSDIPLELLLVLTNDSATCKFLLCNNFVFILIRLWQSVVITINSKFKFLFSHL